MITQRGLDTILRYFSRQTFIKNEKSSLHSHTQERGQNRKPSRSRISQLRPHFIRMYILWLHARRAGACDCRDTHVIKGIHTSLLPIRYSTISYSNLYF